MRRAATVPEGADDSSPVRSAGLGLVLDRAVPPGTIETFGPSPPLYRLRAQATNRSSLTGRSRHFERHPAPKPFRAGLLSSK